MLIRCFVDRIKKFMRLLVLFFQAKKARLKNDFHLGTFQKYHMLNLARIVFRKSRRTIGLTLLIDKNQQ